jgi:hypothetical protein
VLDKIIQLKRYEQFAQTTRKGDHAMAPNARDLSFAGKARKQRELINHRVPCITKHA